MKQRAKKTKDLSLKTINPVVKFLIVSDMLVVGAAGMLGPLFALFVEDFIVGGNALVIGVSMAVYLISRSILQIPVATIIDKKRGEFDDYYLMVVFTIIVGILYLSYLFISEPWQLYLVQILMGLCAAVTYPSYMAIFTRHIDTRKEGTEWGIYFTFTDLSSAALAVVGGYIASFYSFYSLIIVVAVITVFGGLLLIPIKPYIYKIT